MTSLPASNVASDSPPGSVLGLEGEALRMQTGDGQLLLQQLQLPGRKPVSGAEFANAQPSLDGLRFSD